MSKDKVLGLAAFTRPSKNLDKSEVIPSRKKGRRRGQGETVALTVRLTREDWGRVHQLAVSEGVSIQWLSVEGLSKVFEERGLPPLNAMND
ncbi:MAG: hypothetical protein ACMZI2_07595 (plasmid) [Candidatus Symbiodolus clandestinus]